MDCSNSQVSCVVERCLTLSLLCIPFYIFFIVSIIQAIRQPHRSHRFLSFYWLLVSAGVADIWYLIHYFLFNRFKKWYWVTWLADLSPHYSVLGVFWLRQSQALATLFMAVNRLYAICWPMKYQDWKGAKTAKLIIFQWVFSIVPGIPPALKCEISGPSNVTDVLIKNPKGCVASVFVPQMGVQLVISIALIVFYTCMYRRMRKKANQVAPGKANRQQPDRKAQHHLAVAGGIISLNLILYTCTSFVIPITALNPKLNGFNQAALTAQTAFSTLLSIINPFVLVAICENMRKGVVKLGNKVVGKEIIPKSAAQSSRVKDLELK